MQPPFFNDQAYFAETYLLEEDYTGQMARLAFFKINSWKRTQTESPTAQSRTELKKNLQDTLLRSVKPMQVRCLPICGSSILRWPTNRRFPVRSRRNTLRGIPFPPPAVGLLPCPPFKGMVPHFSFSEG